MKNNHELDGASGSHPYIEEMGMPVSLFSNILAKLGLGSASEHLVASSIDIVVQALTDEAFEMRVAAARELGRRREEVAFAPLLMALHDVNGSVRAAVIEALGTFGAQVSVDVLIAALTDSQWEVREAALFALSRLGENVPLAPLLKMLQDMDATVRASAIRVLGTRDVSTSMSYIEAAIYDDVWFVREAAVQVLKQYGRRVNSVLLVHALRDESEMVQLAAIQTLIALEPSEHISAMFTAYEKGMGSVRALAQEGLQACVALALSTLKEMSPIEPIVEALKEMKGSPYKALIRYLLARAINLIHEQIPIDPLIPLLRSEEPTEHAFAWQVITQLAKSIQREREQVDVIIAASKETDQAIRVEADQALIELVSLALSIQSERTSTDQTVAVLQGSDQFASEMVMRDLVAVACKALNERFSLFPIIEGLKDSDGRNRAVAARALTQRVQVASAEQMNPTEPLVISCIRPSQSRSLKIQFGTSQLKRSNVTHDVIPWRDAWSHLLKAKMLVPSALSTHTNAPQQVCTASMN